MLSNRSNVMNLVGIILVFRVNIGIFAQNQSSFKKRNATNYLEVNTLPVPVIPKSSVENLTIFELITLSQLQEFAKNSLGTIDDTFWISTSFVTNLLDSSQWSLQKAKRKIQKAVNWRNNNADIENQLANQNLHDYFDLEMKGYDKENCPVVIIPFGKWRTYRSYIEKIKSIPEATENLKVYFLNVMSTILLQMKRHESPECSQFTLIADMDEYTPLHTWGIKFFIDTIKQFDRVYPGVLKIAYVINSSPYFLKVAKSFKSKVPWDLRRKSFLYTTDKTVWKRALLQNIDESQLAPRYGGTNFFWDWRRR